MRICGISSCFQLVSPCMRQVVHALLTRPPLGWESLGFIPSPFDLHVLGTPPAFILSQDRTLMFVRCPKLAGYQVVLFWFPRSLGSSRFVTLRFLFFLKIPILADGRARSPSPFVWNLQGCIAVRLSRCCAVSFTLPRTEKEGFEPSRRY